jgi:hypothetical protein
MLLTIYSDILISTAQLHTLHDSELGKDILVKTGVGLIKLWVRYEQARSGIKKIL